MKKLSFCVALAALSVVLLARMATAQASETTLYAFTSKSGISGLGPNVIQASDGNFYGVTYDGGANSYGSVFKVSPSGVFTTLYSFCLLADCTDGAYPEAVVEGGDGNLYGTTLEGGAFQNGSGTVFKITLDGVLTTLYAFCSQSECSDGTLAYAPLVQGSDGNFYGSTYEGGNSDADCTGPSSGCGTIFKVTPSGQLTTLYTFNGTTDGVGPLGRLVQAEDGNFYGMGGSFFSITPSGSFDAVSAGVLTQTGLVEAANQNFYGTVGGDNTPEQIYEVTPAGVLQTIASLPGEGSVAYVPALSLGSDGNFYAARPGIDGYDPYGGLLKVTPTGTLTTPYVFTDGKDGAGPTGEIQGGDGNFYGTTCCGSAATQYGTVFKITPSPALAAPVQLTLSESSVSLGEPVTLTWKVLNAFSVTMQQCYAFVPTSTAGAGTWTGLQTGTLVDDVYTGSATITPTADGEFTYSLTCGGIESGFASLNVGGVKAATTTTVSTNSPVILGKAATLSATVGTLPYYFPLAGKVMFKSGPTNIGTVTPVNGVATLSLSTAGIPAGTYPVTATYSGDGNYQPSSETANLVVLGYATKTTLSVSPTTVTQGQSVTLTSKVTRTSVSGTPTGSVTFYYGATALGTAKLVNGVATLPEATSGSILPSVYAITAKYSGDTTDQTATSAAVDITLLAATTTSLTASPNPVPADSSVTLTVKVKETYDSGVPTGTVAFSVEGNSLGSETLSSGAASINASDLGYPAGTYAVKAAYSGDANNAASSATVNVTVE